MTGAALQSDVTLNGQLPGLTTDVAFPLFRDLAERLQLPHAVDGDALTVSLPTGRIRLHRHDVGLGVELATDNPARLYTLREIVHARLDRLETPANLIWERVDEGALPPSLVIAEVLSTTDISPNIRRMRVGGADFRRFAEGGLHFRLMLPPIGREPIWPRIGAAGRTVWPEGSDALHRPVFTTRAVSPAHDWLDIDIYLHDGGRVTQWSAAARPGTRLGLMGPTGREAPSAAWIALFGDETALPAIARILADLPAGTGGEAWIELGDQADRQELAHPEGVAVHWLTRGTDPSLADVLLERPLPASDRFVWFSAEKAQAEKARAYLRDTRKFERNTMSVTAYWAR